MPLREELEQFIKVKRHQRDYQFLYATVSCDEKVSV